MTTIEIVCFSLAMICFAFAGLQIARILWLKPKTGIADAVVTKLTLARPDKPEKSRAWATVKYVVDGVEYEPDKNLIVIPGTKKGQTIQVVYYKDEPFRLLNSPMRFAIIALLFGLVFLFAGTF